MTQSPPPEIIEAARLAAMRSPCAKSKRGSVLFAKGARKHDTRPDKTLPNPLYPDGLISFGFNGPPSPYGCDGSAQCRRDCNQICVHAEAMAINQNTARDWAADEFPEIVHLKVIGETPVATGKPSCVQCSKLILDTWFIAGVWLYERGLPEQECQGINSIHDEEVCAQPAKHIYAITDARMYTPYTYYACDRHMRDGAQHDHAACLAWQIARANDGATWFKYTALEFHEISLATNGLHRRKRKG